MILGRQKNGIWEEPTVPKSSEVFIGIYLQYLAELCQALPCFILYSKAKLACYSRYILTSYFCIPIPDDEQNIFFGFKEVFQSFIEQINFSYFGTDGKAQTWVIVILNGLPWKQATIILSFLRLNPSTVFQTLLLIMKATPSLLWDFLPRVLDRIVI